MAKRKGISDRTGCYLSVLAGRYRLTKPLKKWRVVVITMAFVAPFWADPLGEGGDADDRGRPGLLIRLSSFRSRTAHPPYKVGAGKWAQSRQPVSKTGGGGGGGWTDPQPPQMKSRWPNHNLFDQTCSPRHCVTCAPERAMPDQRSVSGRQGEGGGGGGQGRPDAASEGKNR